MDEDALLRNGRELALRSLLANVEPLASGPALTAGRRQFRSIWTRDFCFASGGLVAAGRRDAARSTLRLILSFQRADGLLPRLLDSASWAARVAWGALGREAPLTGALKPNYVGEHWAPAIDGNALAAWTAERASAGEGGGAFAAEVLPAVEKALLYYDPRLKDGLVVQPPFSDWQDSVRARRGRVFFTNLLYWKGLRSAAELARRAGRGGADWSSRAGRLEEAINRFFWDEGRGTYRNLEAGGPLSSDGCLFSMLWGFGGPERGRRTLAALDGAGIWTPWGPRCAVPDYSFLGRGWITRAAGIPDYHDRMVWLWQSALAVRSLKAVGENARARALALSIAKILERDGGCCEVLEGDDGLPVRRLFYRSETPFSWSSAMTVEAFDELLNPPAAPS